MSLSAGIPRACEWSCLCSQPLRAGSLDRCPRCGAHRPDTAKLAAIAVEAKAVLGALDDFDKLSRQVGRFQAMKQVLEVHGRRG